MTVTLLSSGYWHARLGPFRFIQWPVGRAPKPENGFPPAGGYGAPTERELHEAETFAAAHRHGAP